MFPATRRESLSSVLIGSLGNRLNPLMSFSAVEEKLSSVVVGWVGEEKEGGMLLEMRKKNIKDRDVLRNLDDDDAMLFCFVEKKCGNGYEFIVVSLPMWFGC